MPASKKHVRPLLLKELERHGNKSRACAFVGINRETLARWMRTDMNFRYQADRALRIGRA